MKKNIFSIYFTAGFPNLKDTNLILNELEKTGADMIEIGMPFSDPLADGPIIQHSNKVALKNGMNLKLLFKQLSTANCQLPILLMGYLNPVLQFGVKSFCKCASEVGVSGVIIPDLPMEEYLNDYKFIFNKYDIKNIFLITPQTSEARIKMIDDNTDGFIYLVSSASTTGTNTEMNDEKEKYFSRIKKMNLKNPLMIGFGISNKKSFAKACEYANGAIIGSAFIRAIENNNNLNKSINHFIKTIR
ncbi:MAG: tryptophan synthase subunit alpha [Bacteroidota bacterium]